MFAYRTREVEGRYLRPGDKVLRREMIWKLEKNPITDHRGRGSGLPAKMLTRKNKQSLLLRSDEKYQKLVKKWWLFWWPF